MNINTATHLSADKVDRKIAVLEAFTDYERKDKGKTGAKHADVYIEDKFESSQTIQHFNNYTNAGVHSAITVTQQAAQSASGTVAGNNNVNSSQSGNTPDITANHLWNDPLKQEKLETLRRVYGQRAAESKRTAFPIQHARDRYFNPNVRHFVGHDLSDWERDRAFNAEKQMIIAGRFAYISLSDPIFEGRGLGRSDPAVRRIDHFNALRATPGLTFHRRNMINSQLNDLLQRNGIHLPENLRLSFIIDSQYRLRVTGSDDESLIRQIENLLNSNGNSAQLFTHILQSTTTVERNSNQVRDDSLRKYQVDWSIRRYTDYTRQDLELVKGRFLTKDGVDIMEHIRRGIAEEFRETGGGAGILMEFTRQELEWLAAIGPENIPEMVLTIDFENGHLFDVGQPHGFGPGQTGWISDLIGGGDPHDSKSWL
jgi:hypothetical protein